MQLADFQRMVERMVEEIPADYLEDIAGIEVSPRTVRDATRDGVYTMGECIPIDVGSDPTPSRVVLYYGSFRALAGGRSDFDWKGEAWETVTHELRHHLEWKAATQDLEEYDWAADQGFARADQESFDPLFFLSGERIGPDTYQVDDDVFFDCVVRVRPEATEVTWQNRRYRVTIPREPLPLYLRLRGLAQAPAGDAVLVVRKKPGFLDLLRGRAKPTEREVDVDSLP